METKVTAALVSYMLSNEIQKYFGEKTGQGLARVFATLSLRTSIWH